MMISSLTLPFTVGGKKRMLTVKYDSTRTYDSRKVCLTYSGGSLGGEKLVLKRTVVLPPTVYRSIIYSHFTAVHSVFVSLTHVLP